MRLLVQWLISTLAVLVSAYLLPGVYVESFMTAVIVALVLGCLNAFVKPLMILLALPAVIFSFGLFLFVINTFMIIITDHLVDGFHVRSFGWALLFSMVLWLVTSVFNAIQRRDEHRQNGEL